jgi:hypothetical protein
MNRSLSRIYRGMIMIAFAAACDVEPTPEVSAVCNQPAPFAVDPLGDPSMCSSYEPETAAEPIAVTFVNDGDEDILLRGWGCDGYFQLINARFGRMTLAPVTCLTEQPPCEWMLRGEGSCVASCPRAPDIRIAPGRRFETTWAPLVLVDAELPQACAASPDFHGACMAVKRPVPGGALLTAMFASASQCGATCACEAGAEGWCEVQEQNEVDPSQVRTVSALYDGVCAAVEFSLR